MNTSSRSQRGQARTQRPQRRQIEYRDLSLDQWLDEDHRVRYVWQYVESLDLSELYDGIKAVQGNVGRRPIDPQILFALWLFATIEGVTAARQIAELTTQHIAYMWICGHVSVNHHTLSDFRVDHGELLERLMIDSIAVLMDQELITLETVGQDGMRVRANAGTSSFRRKPTLEARLKEAESHVEQLRQQREDDESGDKRRSKAARDRAAKEKSLRIKAAIKQLDEVNKSRAKNGRDSENTRASTTDPDARRMKMGDGGFRPALNVQFASDGDTRIIVGVDVTQSGSDAGQMSPMHDNLVENYEKNPENYLVDGPYATISDVTKLEKSGTKVHAPLPREQKQLDAGEDPYARKKRDTDAMASFRQRMKTDEAKERYKQRPSIAEFPNAECRNRGLIQFRVRGLAKAKAQTMWHVLANNFMRFRNLGFLETLIAPS